MEASHVFPSGRRVTVILHDNGSVDVTGSENVNVHIPVARRGSGVKAFPKCPEGEVVVAIRTKIDAGQVEITTNGGKPTVVRLEEATLPQPDYQY
jgi:hypothetical protein